MRAVTCRALAIGTVLVAALAAHGSPALAQGEPSAGPDPASEPEGDLGGPAEPAPTTPEAPLDDNQRAAQLFDEGTALYRSQRWREAETYFQESFDLRPVFDTAANLGDCELHIEQFEEAAAHLTFAVNNFPVTGGEDVRTRLQGRLDEARAKVGAVRLTVDVDGAAVSVDGDVVGTTPLSAELFVMPGEHQIEVSKAGHETASQSLSIEAGSSQTVALALPEGGGGGPVGTDEGLPAWPIFVGLGATVAAVGVGVVFRVIGSGQEGDADDRLAEAQTAGQACPSGSMCAEVDGLYEDAAGSYDVSTGLLIGGGALGLGTIIYTIVWATSGGDTESSEAAIQVRPVATPEFAGLGVTGSF